MFSKAPWGLSRSEGLLSFVTGMGKQFVLFLQKLCWFSTVLISLVESQEGEKIQETDRSVLTRSPPTRLYCCTNYNFGSPVLANLLAPGISLNPSGQEL